MTYVKPDQTHKTSVFILPLNSGNIKQNISYQDTASSLQHVSLQIYNDKCQFYQIIDVSSRCLL